MVIGDLEGVESTMDIIGRFECLSALPKPRAKQLGYFKRFISKLNLSEYTNVSKDVLVDIFGVNLYRKAISELEEYGIIDTNDVYSTGRFSKSYKLRFNALRCLKDIQVNKLEKHMKTIDLKYKESQMHLIKWIDYSNERMTYNVSDENVIKVYNKCEAGKYYSKKGNVVKCENVVDVMQYLKSNGLDYRIGTDKCDRIWTSYIYAPSATRADLFTINGCNDFVELDFQAMHPNIVLKLAGYSETITHKEVSEYLGVDIATVKVEHLSFHNKKISDMKRSILWKFYCERFPKVIDLHHEIKVQSHKEMSRLLFEYETIIMGNIAKELLANQLPGMYIYDCFTVEPHNIAKVKEIMMKTVIELGFNNLKVK